MKRTSAPSAFQTLLFLVLGWGLLIFMAYGRLLLNPDLHTACPENDTWNLPVRWSVLTSLREGHLPLWNPLSAFGIPWLATWQTETFYPGTQLFSWLGLCAWNYSGVFHLLILSTGVFCFLRNSSVKTFWAFSVSAIALLNLCSYNHLGSNSSMDTMAWIPWIFLGFQETLDSKPFGQLKLALFLTLQVFAGYPQIIFYTLLACGLYTVIEKNGSHWRRLVLPLSTTALLSACQWIPSMEYFFLNAARLPAVSDNPGFVLPFSNLPTFFNPGALAQPGVPDYVASPTFFYFNFYSGLLPLAVLALGLWRWSSLKKRERFFLTCFFLFLFWALGLFLLPFHYFQIPSPAFLEPAKSWVVINVWMLFTLGLLLESLFPKPGRWKWAFLAAAILNLLYPIWTSPLEENLLPDNPQLTAKSQNIKSHLGSGRILILANVEEKKRLYTPLPDPGLLPLFKYFIPNSNLFVSLPLANFNGSTWPSWGTMDAELYFQYDFPYAQGNLINLLGVDLLQLTEDKMPKPFEKIQTDGTWTLWKNPNSLGSHFLFSGAAQPGSRKEAFTAFASGAADPLKRLYLDDTDISPAPRHALTARTLSQNHYDLPPHSKGFLVITQNASPGWRAWIDGKPKNLFLADGIFQSVTITKDNQQVDLVYEPASFRFGLFLSLLALGGFIGGGFFRKSF